MSNCQTFSLPELEVEPHQVREVLRCLLHTILFTRSLGPTTPVDVSSELFDVTYAKCGDPEVDKLVEAKINEFSAWIERHPGQMTDLVLGFYERRRREVGWLTRGNERMFWEQWCIRVKVAVKGFDDEGVEMRKEGVELSEQVEECIRFVVQRVNQEKDHIPGVGSTSTVSFPFDVWIASDGKLSLGFGLMKKVLMQTVPPPMLG